MTRPASTEELFKQSGGGAPLFFNRDSAVGDTIEGIVFESVPTQYRDYETNALKFWDDGTPMMQLSITLDTDRVDRTLENHDGKYRWFARWWGSDRQAIIEAVQRAGDQYVRDGAWMKITFAGFGEQKDRKLNAPKIFKVEYLPPPSATEKLMNENGSGRPAPIAQQKTTQPSASAGAAPPQPSSNAVADARAVQTDRKAQIAKVQKLLAAGFSESEIVDMVPGMSAEAVSAIVGL